MQRLQKISEFTFFALIMPFATLFSLIMAFAVPVTLPVRTTLVTATILCVACIALGYGNVLFGDRFPSFESRIQKPVTICAAGGLIFAAITGGLHYFGV